MPDAVAKAWSSCPPSALNVSISSEMDTTALRGHLTGRLKGALGSQPEFASRPKSLDAHIAQKVQHLGESLRPRERQYWSWARRLDAEGESVFKMPNDPLAGIESFDERARLRVKDYKSKNAASDAEHQRWIQKVTDARCSDGEQRLALEGKEVKERREASLRRQAQRDEEKRLEDERAAEYLAWAGEPKASVVNAPIPVPGVAREAKERREAKVAAFASEDCKRWADYTEWVKTVEKPTGLLPKNDTSCMTPVQRDGAIKEMASNKHKKFKALQADYDRWMVVVKEKQHERMLNSLEDKRRWNEEVSGDPDKKIAARTAELQQAQQEAVVRHNSFVKSLHAKAKSMPLLVEDSRYPSSFSKRYDHRNTIRRRAVHDFADGES